MKTALILGITGNFGKQMALALIAEGWNIRGLMRDKSKAPTWLPSQDIMVGNANNESHVTNAAEGVDLIVYAVNPVYYRWGEEALPLLEPTVRVAEKMNIRILFPGNVYNFAPSSDLIAEDTPMKPISEKGKIRVQMEDRLRTATKNGAKVTIVRAGDFIGPDTHFTWLDMTLKQKESRATIAFPHNENHIHFWSFLPDLCTNCAKLLSQPQSQFEVWHDPGLRLSQVDWQHAFTSHNITLKVTRFHWWAYKLIVPFVPLVREVFKMRYLWQQPVLLDGRKMKATLGAKYTTTSLANIIPQLSNSK
ncbi:NmrA family NAD(P)-binding protein [Vibrio lamellibrachiae]|uniref:NAD(P)H-binding protein n=1 Tax=Vibrio lamellibrachiae TaxID=2910253 RepID=UPI003D0FC012